MAENKNNNSNSRKQILKLTENFGLLKGKVDQMDKNISDNLKGLDVRVVAMHNSVKTVIRDHDKRIKDIENGFSKMRGKAAGIALAVSLIIGAAGLLIAFVRAAF